MQLDQAAALLAKTALFQHLDDAKRRLVAGSTIERRFRPGQAIYYQDEQDERLYVVAEGSVKLAVTGARGEIWTLAIRQAPDTFGELGFIAGRQASSAYALEEATVLIAPRVNLASLLEGTRDRQAMSDALLASTARQLALAIEQASDVVFLAHPERVAKALLKLAGDSSGGTLELPLAITQRDIAEMTGSSRVRVNQILKSFERRGWLRLSNRGHRKTVTILSPLELSRLAHLE